ncbi:MAG: hypothetical protein QXU98_08440 [Candidatus Parvarchaeota archaeon]
MRKSILPLILIAMLLITPSIASAQTTTIGQQVGGGMVGAALGALYCKNVAVGSGGGLVGGIVSAVGSTAAYVACVGAVATIVGLYTPIFIMIFLIIIFEMLIRFDIIGATSKLLNALGKIGSKGISLLPPPPSAQSNAYLFKLQAPLYAVLNINRAILYIGLFLAFALVPPFAEVLNLPASLIGYLYGSTAVLMNLEPLFLGIILPLIGLDMLIDVGYIIVNMVSGRG